MRFHTPHPATIGVFYEEGVRLYQTAAEAVADMSSRGLPVTVLPSTPTSMSYNKRSVWNQNENRPVQRSAEEHQPYFVEKLQEVNCLKKNWCII